jgi:hypothetical protein
MDQNNLRDMLEEYKQGKLSADQVLDQLKLLPFEAVDEFVNIDHHRSIRTGIPEVIYGQGKTPEQVTEIFSRLQRFTTRILATRVDSDMYAKIKDQLPNATYNPDARLLYLEKDENMRAGLGIIVMSAGTSDIPVAEEAAITVELMGCKVDRIYDVGVAGLHRLMEHLPAIQHASVIIVVAGMEGALPSVVGGLVSAPIIAVPTSVGYGASFQGLSALLGMLTSCAPGIAVVNIDNGFGAGCLAVKIVNQIEKKD